MKTTREAAAFLGVTRRRVQQLVKRGQLKARKVGRDWLIDDDALRRYVPQPVGRPA